MNNNAAAQMIINDPKAIALMNCLFGTDKTRQHLVRNYFTMFSHLSLLDDFTIICGDPMFKLDKSYEHLDPRGLWVDNDHGLIVNPDKFIPCDPRRIINTPRTNVRAYTIRGRYIFLCPLTLNQRNGRSLAPFKDRLLLGKSINDYFLLPVILFHELLHTHILFPNQRKFHFGSWHHIVVRFNRKE